MGREKNHIPIQEEKERRCNLEDSETKKKHGFCKVIMDEDIFYACVRWLVLIIGIATLVILVFAPAVSYLRGKHAMSQMMSMVINAMGVASLLLAIHSLTESRTSNKEIHEVTTKLERFSDKQERNVNETLEGVQKITNQLKELASCQEINVNQTMEKLEELGKTQENIHTLLKNSSTVAKERILPQQQQGVQFNLWTKEYSTPPGTADPEDISTFTN